MKTEYMIFYLLMLALSCQAQMHSETKLVGGPCEGCEAVFEYDSSELTATDTLVDFNEQGPKLKITGTVYEEDGTTPAKDVILYIYHTNQDGIYPTNGNEKGWAKRHGYIRGWIKTGENGKYNFYTLKPGTYPSKSQPAHIHITVLEPNGRYYWIQSYYFADDPLLNLDDLKNSNPRGGLGVLNLKGENDLLAGVRDIILGKNIPGYNTANSQN